MSFVERYTNAKYYYLKKKNIYWGTHFLAVYVHFTCACLWAHFQEFWHIDERIFIKFCVSLRKCAKKIQIGQNWAGSYFIENWHINGW